MYKIKVTHLRLVEVLWLFKPGYIKLKIKKIKKRRRYSLVRIFKWNLLLFDSVRMLSFVFFFHFTNNQMIVWFCNLSSKIFNICVHYTVTINPHCFRSTKETVSLTVNNEYKNLNVKFFVRITHKKRTRPKSCAMKVIYI